MNKKIIVLAFLIVIALSAVAYGGNKVIEATEDITLEEIETCKTNYWNETQIVYGECIRYSEETVCNDAPLNTSCHVSEVSSGYQCRKDDEIVERSEELCSYSGIEITIDKFIGSDKLMLDYGDWGKCSQDVVEDRVLITCDSKYDGNNDGICTSGESCMQFEVTKGQVKKMMKNSRADFVEKDKTFFLEELDMKEVE